MSSTNPWDALFRGFSQRKRERRERAEQSRELVAWYDEQSRRVMELVREVVQERAQAFKSSTGAEVEVRWPSHPPINIDPDGPFMSFMSLALGRREVHLYSHRVGGDAPLVHYVVTASGEMARGLVSRPGCRIERRESGGFLLRALEPDGDRILSIDDLAFRAFELLLGER